MVVLVYQRVNDGKSLNMLLRRGSRLIYHKLQKYELTCLGLYQRIEVLKVRKHGCHCALRIIISREKKHGIHQKNIS